MPLSKQNPLTVNLPQGEAGNITIETEKLSLRNGGRISVSTTGFGNSGNLFIFAEEIKIDGGETDFSTGLFAEVEEGATGKGGDINIGSEQFPIEQLNLINEARISTDTSGEGDAGNISIYSNGSISLENSNIFSEVNNNAVGNSGATTIFTNTLNLTNSSIIGNRVFGEGKGGDINLGNEQFPIQQLELTNGAQITVSTFNEGDAGNLFIFSDNIEINAGEDGFDTGFLAQVREDATGQGGDISLGSEQFSIQQLNVVDGAGISVSTFGQGNAGNLFVFVSSLELDGGKNGFDTGLFAQVRENAMGQGGNINIGSRQFFVEQININNGAKIVVSTFGQGKAGDIKINANSLDLNNDVFIVSRSESSNENDFDAGDITLNITNFLQATDSSKSLQVQFNLQVVI